MPEPSQLDISIPSSTTEGLAVQEQIIALMEQHDYSMKDVFAMRLALEEAITNAIKHGNKGALDKQVTISATVSDDALLVEVQDEGDGFDPEDVPDPTDDEHIDRPSGRGLMLMRAYLDRVEYSDGGRRITMERQRHSERPIVDDDD